jgi:hypothetical protein
MNATTEYVSALPRHSLWRLLQRRANPDSLAPSRADLVAAVLDRYALDLVGFLNRANREELDRIAAAVQVDSAGAIGELRAKLWIHGATLEAGGAEEVGRPWQPLPIVLGGKLVHMGSRGGISPPIDRAPRPIPPAVDPPDGVDEPECFEQLLEAASRLLGVRLGLPGRDKGAFGSRIAELLGVPERGISEPDWRGEVEIKTLPVVRDRSGFWRVKEDPAVSMEHASPIAKLSRVLWIARVADDAASPILSWFYQELDAGVGALVERYIHRRPKGGAGATTRGWYLHKRFFAESGLLRSLNG